LGWTFCARQVISGGMLASEAVRQYQGRTRVHVEVRVQQRRRSRADTAVSSQQVLVKHVEIRARVLIGRAWLRHFSWLASFGPTKSHLKAHGLRNYQIIKQYVCMYLFDLFSSMFLSLPSCLFSSLSSHSLSLSPSPCLSSHSLFVLLRPLLAHQA
jgi:hypothetical protein